MKLGWLRVALRYFRFSISLSVSADFRSLPRRGAPHWVFGRRLFLPWTTHIMGWLTNRGKRGVTTPVGAPPEWKDDASAVFDLLDKEGAGYITTVPADAPKVAGHCHSEISVLGDEVLEAQRAAGDFGLQLSISRDDWLATLSRLTSEDGRGWEPVGTFLQAISTAASNGVGKKGEVDEASRACFSALSDMMAGGPQSDGLELDAFDVIGAVEELCKSDPGVVRIWCKSLLAGLCLPQGMPLSIDEWVAHCELRAEEIGWPRCIKMLITLTSHAESVRARATMSIDA